MAATARRRRTFTEKDAPYTVAGDPRARTFATFAHAMSAAINLAEHAHDDDGEEYRHGILFYEDELVGAAIRAADGVVTAIDYRGRQNR